MSFNLLFQAISVSPVNSYHLIIITVLIRQSTRVEVAF